MFLPQQASFISKSVNMFDEIVKKPCAQVIPVPLFTDNYAYLLVEPGTKNAWCVDPAEAKTVVAAAAERDLTLTGVLCTHKHYDHSGGNEEIQRLVPQIHVYTSAYESVPGSTNAVMDGDVLRLGPLEVRCIRAPCHTVGHMLYYVSNPSDPASQSLLFSGDTLFIAGVGRFFEGSAAQMLDILHKLRELPRDTLVYCGHEYTVKNLEFAKTVEDCDAVSSKLKWAERLRSEGLPTVPSTLGQEMEYNPFMRAGELRGVLGETTEEAALAKLRSMKDRF
ncbi:hydroxyacylglutathione hydrolase, putative [Babesia caballi]|uniref:hydroxyacylglutathione hydrolase n=1 Tax=Babesia caballi TaxID=5871 RepID=A0AAV4M2Q7_BABCB|nr:hydroxyacylglutathione hydrolase, putative [Babesia caballi]